MEKNYVTLSEREIAEVFKGYIDNNSVKDEILIKLARDLGFSFDTYNTLSIIDQSSADTLVATMCRKTDHQEVAFLIDESSNEVLGYSLEAPRTPILNEDFMKRVRSLAETSSEIKLEELYLASDDTLASVLVKKVTPIEIDLGSSQASYEIGILLVNNELENTYCRLAIYIDGQPVYLPASYYNASSSRYKKSTGTSEEALEVLMLKVIDELREDALKEKVQNFHMIYRNNKEILTSYEEYNTVLRAMMRIPSIIDDHSLLESLNMRYNEFEEKYAHIVEQKSSYIWRCTAMGDLTIGGLVHLATVILGELGAPAMEYYNIRELTGNYLSTKRIASEIALEDM